MSAKLDAARAALREIVDPDAGINIVDLGLIYDLREDGDGLVVTMTFTTPECPAGPLLRAAAEQALRQLAGVELVRVDVTFEPRWTPDRITPQGRAALS